MTTVFTNAGEFRRGKGNRKTRLGPRMNADVVSRQGGVDRQVQTPDDIAIKKLIKLLDKPGISPKDRYNYGGLMRNAEQIRFMNMPVLAEVLLYMHNVGNIVTELNFSYGAILPYVDRLLPRKEIMEGGIRPKEISEEEIQVMRLRMAVTFLRYIRYVTSLREQAAQDLETAQNNQEDIAPPIIDEL